MGLAPKEDFFLDHPSTRVGPPLRPERVARWVLGAKAEAAGARNASKPAAKAPASHGEALVGTCSVW